MPEISQIRHPLYDQWVNEWRLLRDAYEGTGGFLDGSHLVAHPREIDYKIDAKGRPTTEKLRDKPKFTRRKAIARYEHFASAIIDTLIGYQFDEPIVRTVGGKKSSSLDTHPLAQWWQDVDGFGTHIDDWIQHAQELAHVYGHIFVLMDRTPLEGMAMTRAEQARPRLLIYTPLDVWDWLVDRGHLTSIKTVDYLERSTLAESPIVGVSEQKEFRVWTAEGWQTFDNDGAATEDTGEHQMGEIPVMVFHGRRRAGERVVGRSSLGSATLYKDHYNQISELRELLRAQTFAMLNIQLGENETVTEARQRLGESSGVETLLFSKAPANFIAPPPGPAATYQEELSKVERKMYRAAGVPWEDDSRDAESGEARGRKQQELSKRLSLHADEAERIDYAIARLFYIAFHGRDLGLQRYASDEIVISHPGDFSQMDPMVEIDTVKAKLDLPVGPTARRLILQRVIPLLLEDLDDTDRDAIAKELEEQAQMPPPAPPQENEAPDDAEETAA